MWMVKETYNYFDLSGLRMEYFFKMNYFCFHWQCDTVVDKSMMHVNGGTKKCCDIVSRKRMLYTLCDAPTLRRRQAGLLHPL